VGKCYVGNHCPGRFHVDATIRYGAFHLFVHHDFGRHAWLPNRQPFSGVTELAQIQIRNLKKSYGDFTAVRDSTFDIQDGEFFVMLGPSGCGKTTTLRMIAGLEVPDSGQILLDNDDVTFKAGSERDIAFVFQLFALYPHMSVGDNISFPLTIQGVRGSVKRAKTMEVAKMLQIEHLLKSSVSGLSSGDRQRVALGRALVREAKAFLMDEPLGALDAEFRDLMCEELRLLHNRVGATTVYVTHDQVEAMSMADRICVMNAGNVLQIAPPREIYARPKTKFVAGFIGSPSMNFIQAKGLLSEGSQTVRVEGGEIKVPVLHEHVASNTVFIGARPEHISLSDAGAIRGRVLGVEYMGARQLITVDTSAGRLRVQSNNDQKASIGEAVGLDFDPTSLIVFDGNTEKAIASALFAGAAHV
jgi:multiple sugar transport system ATP-binding protein